MIIRNLSRNWNNLAVPLLDFPFPITNLGKMCWQKGTPVVKDPQIHDGIFRFNRVNA